MTTAFMKKKHNKRLLIFKNVNVELMQKKKTQEKIITIYLRTERTPFDGGKLGIGF